jgi:hypothetical protein
MENGISAMPAPIPLPKSSSKEILHAAAEQSGEIERQPIGRFSLPENARDVALTHANALRDVTVGHAGALQYRCPMILNHAKPPPQSRLLKAASRLLFSGKSTLNLKLNLCRRKRLILHTLRELVVTLIGIPS